MNGLDLLDKETGNVAAKTELLTLRVDSIRALSAKALTAGLPALERLMDWAEKNDESDALVCAKILLGCHNGEHFAFSLAELRTLDEEFLADALAVMELDANHHQELHEYFTDGENRFAALADKFGLESEA